MKYFTISELLHSDTAIAKKIWNGANKEQEENLRALVENVLDPLRESYGSSIRVTSGFRCPTLNKAVGGVSNSQHIRGEAADLDTGSQAENRKLAQLIVKNKLPFDQLIDEANYAWVHVSHKRGGQNRGQILRMRGGKYTSIKAEEL